MYIVYMLAGPNGVTKSVDILWGNPWVPLGGPMGILKSNIGKFNFFSKIKIKIKNSTF